MNRAGLSWSYAATAVVALRKSPVDRYAVDGQTRAQAVGEGRGFRPAA
jgi:hypothetical protein